MAEMLNALCGEKGDRVLKKGGDKMILTAGEEFSKLSTQPFFQVVETRSCDMYTKL